MVSNEEGAEQLRKSFVIYIIPMLNPDGVIYGNHRCSLLGVDLNRRWLNPSKVLHPVIYTAKNLVKMICEDREVPIYIDMHSHFRIKEPFMYCCNMLFDSFMFDSRSKNAFLRVLPLLLSQKNQMFSFKESSFMMEKFKESSSRIVFFKEFGILNSVTLENSFLFKKMVEVEYTSDEENQNNEDRIGVS